MKNPFFELGPGYVDMLFGQVDSYLVIFVGGVVLEEDDALTVQAPVVSLPLFGSGRGREVKGQRSGWGSFQVQKGRRLRRREKEKGIRQ